MAAPRTDARHDRGRIEAVPHGRAAAPPCLTHLRHHVHAAGPRDLHLALPPASDHSTVPGPVLASSPLPIAQRSEIQDQRWDDDTWDLVPSADDPHGITTYTITFTSTSKVYESAAKALPNSDAWGDDNEEMYHAVRFRVTSNGVTSPWTKWEDSTVVSFHL